MTLRSFPRARVRALALGLAALLAAGTLPLLPGPAVAADDSAVTIPIDDIGEVTVSKTRDLADGESITVSGRIAQRVGSDAYIGVSQAGTAYRPVGADVGVVTEGERVRVPFVADDAGPDLSAFRATFPVSAVLEGALDGSRYDGRTQQTYLLVGGFIATHGDRPATLLTSDATGFQRPIFVPLAFAGGAAELAADIPATITAQPASIVADIGDAVSFTASAAGEPAPALQWQASEDNGESWAAIPGETSATLARSAALADDGLQFRLRASNRIGPAYSAPAVLSIDVPESTGPIEPEPEEPFDRTKIVLTAPGSWARATPLTGLVDGQEVRVEASYSRTDSRWNADGVEVPYTSLPAAQIVEAEGSEPTSRAVMAVLPSTAAGGRHTVDAAFPVSRYLTGEDGAVTDCLVTQCYLALGGSILDEVDYFEVTAPGLVAGAYFFPQEGGASAADNGNTRRVPLFFEGTELVPPPAPEPPTPVVRELPAYTAQPADVTVLAGFAAQFQATVTGTPAPTLQWQRSVDEGATWQTIRGAASASIRLATTEALDGFQYRLRATNDVGTVYSRAATLAVTPGADDGNDPGVDIRPSGISLDWVGSPELQRRSPAYTANYYSAGVSEGNRATYRNHEGGAVIVFRSKDGAEKAQTYENLAAHLPATPAAAPTGDEQLVRLNDGVLTRDARGGGSVRWDARWSINFYGGFVPFTLSNPVLTWDRDGNGTLRADLSGFGSSMDDPEVKVPLAPAPGVVIATFSNAAVDAEGVFTATPDWEGVAVDVPADVSPQDRSTPGWGSWPQGFVDFQVLTGLSSYWYSSGLASDPYKAASPLRVAGLSAVVIGQDTAPTTPAAPTLTRTADAALTAVWAAPEYDGGTAVTGYEVTLRAGDEVIETREVTGTSTTFAGLATGRGYTATVAARNGVGLSPVSAASAVVALPADEVTAPRPTAPPVLVTDGAFTRESDGVPITVIGSTIAVHAGAEHANAWIGVSVHSIAQFVGWNLADAAGDLTIPLPTGLAAGTHHVAAYAADGTVLGYAAFVVAAPPAPGDPAPGGDPGAAPLASSGVESATPGVLPATGSDATSLRLAASLGLVLLLAGVTVAASRRPTPR